MTPTTKPAASPGPLARGRLLVALVAVGTFGACESVTPTSTPQPVAAAAATKREAVPACAGNGAATPACAGKGGAEHAAAGHECAAAAGPPASQPVPKLKLEGGDRLALGQKLGGSTPVTVAQLKKEPAAYAGKTVRIDGKITALCHHRRGWFAVKDPTAADEEAIRVITVPAFLVPENAIGRQARTEGKVEVVEVPAATARYFAKGHGVGNPEAFKSGQPVKQVIIRAVGAEFI
jgi:hypothetical protein